MRYVQLNGIRLSAIGLGTWQFGSWEWGYGATYASGEAAAIVARALDLGINLIDTAEAYGFGRSERILAPRLAGARATAFRQRRSFPSSPSPPWASNRLGRARPASASGRTDLSQWNWPNPC